MSNERNEPVIVHEPTRWLVVRLGFPPLYWNGISFDPYRHTARTYKTIGSAQAVARRMFFATDVALTTATENDLIKLYHTRRALERRQSNAIQAVPATKPPKIGLGTRVALKRLEKLLGDDVIPGAGAPWDVTQKHLTRLPLAVLQSLAYRVERRAAASYESGQRERDREK